MTTRQDFNPADFNVTFQPATERLADGIETRTNDADYRGIFVTKDFKVGEILMSASPISTISFKDPDQEARGEFIIGAWNSLLTHFIASDRSQSSLEVFQQISQLCPRKPDQDVEIFAQEMKQTAVSASLLHALFYFRIKRNSFNPDSHVKTLYYTPSFINHSCIPNAIQMFDKQNVIYIKAARDLRAGEEVCISYIDEIILPGRQEKLRLKSINCNCEACRNGMDTVAYSWIKLIENFATVADPKRCHFCKQETFNLKLCSKCKRIKYCSEECQRIDWKIHKLACPKMKKFEE